MPWRLGQRHLRQAHDLPELGQPSLPAGVVAVLHNCSSQGTNLQWHQTQTNCHGTNLHISCWHHIQKKNQPFSRYRDLLNHEYYIYFFSIKLPQLRCHSSSRSSPTPRFSIRWPPSSPRRVSNWMAATQNWPQESKHPTCPTRTSTWMKLPKYYFSQIKYLKVQVAVSGISQAEDCKLGSSKPAHRQILKFSEWSKSLSK